jgi:DNA transformation protein and related proteins
MAGELVCRRGHVRVIAPPLARETAMSVSDGFLDFVRDHLAPLGGIALKRMFGGAGVMWQGRMIGVVDDDTLYFRVGDAMRPEYAAAGSGPFVYRTKKGPMTMDAYWRVPEAALDDGEDMRRLARAAMEALGPAAKKKPAKKKPAAARKPAANKARKKPAKTPALRKPRRRR